MGLVTRSLKGVGVGWPNVGWQPPPGYTGRSITDITVNHDTAMGVGAFHAGVRLIAEDIASLPFNVLVHLTGGGSAKAFTHPAYAMLHDAPNPEMTAMVWRETAVGHYLTWGNHFSEKEFDGQGNVVRLWPLRPDRAVVKRNDAGERVYDYRLPNGETVRLPARNVFHVPGFGFDGLIGYSRVTMWRRAIENAIAIEEYGLETFANGAAPGVTIKHPAQLSKDAKKNIVTSWEENHQGLSNTQRTGILDEGMTIEQIGFAPEDAQFLEGKRHSVEDMARALRLAPHKLSDMSRATFCLPGDELVLTEHGPRPIRDITAGTNVWSRGENGLVLAPVTATALSGYGRVLTIRTTNRTLHVTAGHRVLARRRSRVPGMVGAMVGSGTGSNPTRVRWTTEWTEAGQLAAGDTLVTLDSLPETGTIHAPTRLVVSVGFIEFCGLLVGDGNVTMVNGQPVGAQIARAEAAPYMDHYRDVIRREFVAYSPVGSHGPHTRPVNVREDTRQTRFKSVLAGEELAFLGFCGTARTKRVPGWIFGLTPELRIAFLRGYLDADGSVDKLGRISFSSAGRLLLEDMRHLCMGLGIPVTNIRSYRAQSSVLNGRPVVPTGDQHTFTCSDPGANRRIGSHDPRYVDRLGAGRPFGRKGRAYPDFGGATFAEAGLGLSRIVAVNEDRLEQPVYDLSVAGTASFVASGVVVHNSNIEESNLDHVISTLTPIMVRFEQQTNKDILGPGPFYGKHNAAAAMRGNAKDRADFYVAMRGIGVLTSADIRALEDLNPFSAADMQDVLWPLNTVPASAYDANGMTANQRMATASLLVRAGFEPDATLAALHLPAIAHTGLVPVTVNLPDTGVLP